MKLAFINPKRLSPRKTYTVLKWAQSLSKRHDVFVVSESLKPTVVAPFAAGSNQSFKIVDLAALKGIELDMAVATSWDAAFDLSRTKTSRAVMLQTSLETQGSAAAEQDAVRAVMKCGLPIIATAHWLKRIDTRNFGVDQALIQSVLIPLDKTIWQPSEPKVPKTPGRVRCLIDGHGTGQIPRIASAIASLERLGLEYIFLGPRKGPIRLGPSCISHLETIQYQDLPKIYSSADILVQLVASDDQLTTPLEMLATGGTAVAWDAWGSEDYLVHRHNALVVPTYDLRAIEDMLLQLAQDHTLLSVLKRRALLTAASWPSWDDAREKALETALLSVPAVDLGSMSKCLRTISEAPKIKPPLNDRAYGLLKSKVPPQVRHSSKLLLRRLRQGLATVYRQGKSKLRRRISALAKSGRAP